uniref:Uncharacterized protein n=1 Tax=Rhizophora mucronata TaxID=61149 RepID=A0A2P2NVU5_RHIMU
MLIVVLTCCTRQFLLHAACYCMFESANDLAVVCQ